MGQEQARTVHPGVAAVLSFVFNGLGQLYNGQILKGLVIIFLSAIGMLIFILGSVLIGFWLLGKAMFGQELIYGIGLSSAGMVFICVIAIYSIVDAYGTAAKR